MERASTARADLRAIAPHDTLGEPMTPVQSLRAIDRTTRSVRDACLRSILACVCVLLAAGCEAIVPYHWDSAEKDGERTELVLELLAAQDAKPMMVALPREGKRTALRVDPAMFEARLGKLLARTQSTSSRPPYAWGARTAADFYSVPPRAIGASGANPSVTRVEVKPGIRGFRLERWLGDQHATTLEFSIEPVDDAFRVTLDRITVHYSRAKVADCSWVNWWARIPLLYGFAFDVARVFSVEYGDNAVDMQVDLAFSAAWTDAYAETHFAPIAVLGWTVLDVPLSGVVREVGESSGWLPLPPPSVREFEGATTTFGQGHFALWTFVTEQDELAQDFVAERKTVGEYFDEILGLLPIPMPPLP